MHRRIAQHAIIERVIWKAGKRGLASNFRPYQRRENNENREEGIRCLSPLSGLTS